MLRVHDPGVQGKVNPPAVEDPVRLISPCVSAPGPPCASVSMPACPLVNALPPPLPLPCFCPVDGPTLRCR